MEEEAQKTEMDYISFKIEPELKAKFEEKIRVEERTISSAIRFLIRKYLGEE